MPSLKEVVDLVHGWYPPSTAESWDAVGLVSGDPDAVVHKVMLAVDPVLPVADEAAGWGADLLVIHHPLFLKAGARRSRHDPQGPDPGPADRRRVRTAHRPHQRRPCGRGSVGGAGDHPRAGGYRGRSSRPRPDPWTRSSSSCRSARSNGSGPPSSTPAPDASATTTSAPSPPPARAASGRSQAPRPRSGEIGRVEVVEELRVEAVLPRARRSAVISGDARRPPLRGAGLRPPRARRRGPGGNGDRTDRTTSPRPRCAGSPSGRGRRAAGDRARRPRRGRPRPGRPPGGGVRRSGRLPARPDGRAATPTSTSPATCATTRRASSSSRTAPPCVDVAHWAAEWTWLPVVEARLDAALGDTVETRVSTLVTDPWQFRL